MAAQELRDLMATAAVARATFAEDRVLENIMVPAHRQELTAAALGVAVYRLLAVEAVAAPEHALPDLREVEE